MDDSPQASPPLPRRKRRLSPTTVFCAAVLAVFAATALWAGATQAWYAWRDQPAPWNAQDMAHRYEPPGPGHVLGTDGLGRSVALRLAAGSWIAFQVGVVSSAIAIPLGMLLGALAGYFGGKTDDFVNWLCATFSAIPGLLFVLVLAAIVGKGLFGVFLAIGLTTWIGVCRLVRAEVVRQKALGYVLAAQALGFSDARILFRHILPNVMHLGLVTFTLRFPASIGTEVFLSFLGIGVQDLPSWGLMISSGRLRLWQGAWWELASVTAAIFLVVLAFHLAGDRLRDRLDPRAASLARK